MYCLLFRHGIAKSNPGLKCYGKWTKVITAVFLLEIINKKIYQWKAGRDTLIQLL